jgi:hypothetical protein
MNRCPEWLAMQLYRATALIAVVLIVLLSAGYAAGEQEPSAPTLAPNSSLR